MVLALVLVECSWVGLGWIGLDGAGACGMRRGKEEGMGEIYGKEMEMRGRRTVGRVLSWTLDDWVLLTGL